MSAEYMVAHGNSQVMLCERGIRTFETATRNTCDISAVPVLNEITHLPVILDPSHATGKRSLVPRALQSRGRDRSGRHDRRSTPLSRKAVSDGAQSPPSTASADDAGPLGHIEWWTRAGHRISRGVRWPAVAPARSCSGCHRHLSRGLDRPPQHPGLLRTRRPALPFPRRRRHRPQH